MLMQMLVGRETSPLRHRLLVETAARKGKVETVDGFTITAGTGTSLVRTT